MSQGEIMNKEEKESEFYRLIRTIRKQSSDRFAVNPGRKIGRLNIYDFFEVLNADKGKLKLLYQGNMAEMTLFMRGFHEASKKRK